MLTISYSGKSKPSALALAEAGNGEVELVRRSSPAVDINWGRNVANSQLNPNINNSVNKRVMRELFKEHGVPMPKLVRGFDYRDPDSGYTFPIIGRPDQHSKGRGLWKCYTVEDTLRAMQGTRKKKAATHFMEYIESDREYRCHVFKGKSIRISVKVFNEDGTYTTGKPGDIKLRKVREAAKAALEAVALDFGAVDILARGDKNQEVFVLEVNASPGLGGTMPQLYVDTFNKWKEGEWDE